MGRTRRDRGQRNPDGVLSCATEQLSQHVPLALRTRMDTRKVTTEDRPHCVFCHRPMSEPSFLRRKVARGVRRCLITLLKKSERRLITVLRDPNLGQVTQPIVIAGGQNESLPQNTPGVIGALFNTE